MDTKGLKIAFLLMLMPLLLTACLKSNDKPPRIDAPLPKDHVGVYKSNDITFTFSGNGETVIAEFSERMLELLKNPPNKAEYVYTFTWYDFGEFRYDGATNLVLYHNDTGIKINFSLSEAPSFDRIVLSYPSFDKELQVLMREAD